MIPCGYVAAYVGIPQCVQYSITHIFTLYALQYTNIRCYITTRDH